MENPLLPFRKLDHSGGQIQDPHLDVVFLKIPQFLGDVLLVPTEPVQGFNDQCVTLPQHGVFQRLVARPIETGAAGLVGDDVPLLHPSFPQSLNLPVKMLLLSGYPCIPECLVHRVLSPLFFVRKGPAGFQPCLKSEK